MNRGDTLSFVLDFSVNFEPLEKDAYSEIELQINEEGGTRKNLKLLLSKGDIQWDDEQGKYIVTLSQEDTFGLPNEMSYQLRLLSADSDEVYSSPIGHFRLGDVLSKKVLE